MILQLGSGLRTLLFQTSMFNNTCKHIQSWSAEYIQCNAAMPGYIPAAASIGNAGDMTGRPASSVVFITIFCHELFQQQLFAQLLFYFV